MPVLRQLLLRGVLAVCLIALSACGSAGSPASGTDTPQDGPPEPTGSALRPTSALQSDCYGWPADPFTPENRAYIELRLTEGDAAVDFTLDTPGGLPARLADLLDARPVLLVMGAFT
jgi:hypothetical protein